MYWNYKPGSDEPPTAVVIGVHTGDIFVNGLYKNYGMAYFHEKGIEEMFGRDKLDELFLSPEEKE